MKVFLILKWISFLIECHYIHELYKICLKLQQISKQRLLVFNFINDTNYYKMTKVV